MAKPQYYPDWATDDVNLPSTGKTNKVRPREIIRTTGWDKGQIPTAEEMNWMFNNWGLWIHYFQDEYLPTIPQTYLPKNGTSLVFTGDLTGQIDWTGTNQGTGNIQVVDNSHNHVSSNITDATFSPISNVIVKRSDTGGAYFKNFLGIYVGQNSTAEYSIMNSNNQVTGGFGGNGSDRVWVYSSDGQGTSRSRLDLYNGYIYMTNPRTSTPQEDNADSLVRLDYLNSRIDDLNNNLVNFVNGKTSANFINGETGWWRDNNTGLMIQWGRAYQPPRDDGNPSYVAFPTQFPNTCVSMSVTHGKRNNTFWSPTISSWVGTVSQAGAYIRSENDFWWQAIGF